MAPNRVPDMIMNDLDFSESDEEELEILETIARYEEEENEATGSSSSRGLSEGRNIAKRDILGGQKKLFPDYFLETPIYGPLFFQRRCRMSRSLFLRINREVQAYDPYFIQKRNCAGKLGLLSLQKMTAALRMLSYGAPAHSMDEYVRIGASTAIKSLNHFVKAIIADFSEEHLRSPNEGDIARLLAVGEMRLFPGMLGSLDCMHWEMEELPNRMEKYAYWPRS